jgi:hypothetical protein
MEIVLHALARSWAADERSAEAEKYQLNYVPETAPIVTSILPYAINIEMTIYHAVGQVLNYAE